MWCLESGKHVFLLPFGFREKAKNDKVFLNHIENSTNRQYNYDEEIYRTNPSFGRTEKEENDEHTTHATDTARFGGDSQPRAAADLHTSVGGGDANGRRGVCRQ